MMSDRAFHSRVWRELAAACLVGLLFLYLLIPILNSAHVEGFSAQIQSLALALKEGWVERHDLDLPLVSQFLYTSRPGVVALLAGVDVLVGASSDLNFRLLVTVSLLVLVASSCIFARRWGGASYVQSLLAIILVPGSLVLGFYFNDNVVSAAFAAAALAVIGPRSGLPMFAISGVLMAAAALCRIDGLLALPMVALLAPMQRPTVRHVALAAIAFLSSFVLVAGIAALLTGFTFVDAVRLAGMFEPPDRRFRGLIQALYFFGLISPPLLAFGALTELLPLKSLRAVFGDGRRFWRLALLFLYPAALLACAVVVASEMRYLFPLLLPLIALHGAKGIEQIVAALKQGGIRFAAATAFIVYSVAIFFCPPLWIQVRDGPSQMLGYAWSPQLWDRWQSLQDESFKKVETIVQDASVRPRSLLVSSAWNDEYYMRLRLMEAGYRSVETPAAFPGCSGFATYRRAGSTVLHIRLWPQYWQSPFQAPEHAALFLTTAFACPAIRAAQDIWLVTFSASAVNLFRSVGIESLSFSEPLEVRVTTSPLERNVRQAVRGSKSVVAVMPRFAAKRITQAELAALNREIVRVLPDGRPFSPQKRAEMLQADARSYQALPLGWSR